MVVALRRSAAPVAESERFLSSGWNRLSLFTSDLRYGQIVWERVRAAYLKAVNYSIRGRTEIPRAAAKVRECVRAYVRACVCAYVAADPRTLAVIISLGEIRAHEFPSAHSRETCACSGRVARLISHHLD